MRAGMYRCLTLKTEPFFRWPRARGDVPGLHTLGRGYTVVAPRARGCTVLSVPAHVIMPGTSPRARGCTRFQTLHRQAASGGPARAGMYLLVRREKDSHL